LPKVTKAITVECLTNILNSVIPAEAGIQLKKMVSYVARAKPNLIKPLNSGHRRYVELLEASLKHPQPKSFRIKS